MSGNIDVTIGNIDVTADPRREADEAADVRAGNVRAVRLGHGANCSSLGSVVDTLFVTAAIGGALLAAILASMKDEPLRVVGDRDTRADARAASESDGILPEPDGHAAVPPAEEPPT